MSTGTVDAVPDALSKGNHHSSCGEKTSSHCRRRLDDVKLRQKAQFTKWENLPRSIQLHFYEPLFCAVSGMGRRMFGADVVGFCCRSEPGIDVRSPLCILLNVDHDDSSLLTRLHISKCLDDFFQEITAIKDAPEPAFCHQVCEAGEESIMASNQLK